MKKLSSFLFLLIILISCSKISFDMPQGPKGEPGLSAYEIWKDQVELGNINWPKEKTEIADFMAYIKGEKGDKGDNGLSAYQLWKNLIAQNDIPNPHDPSSTWPASKNSEADFWDYLTGRDGVTPHIGDNGNWHIGKTDTKIKAIGKDGIDGKDGLSAYEIWQKEVEKGTIDWPKDQVDIEHFFLFLKGKDGKDGITPHVGTNGNWYIGKTDTGVKAQGPKGDQGNQGADGLSPYVKEGYWWVGDKNTGVKAQGPKGEQGIAGINGLTPFIKNGYWWIGDTNTGIKAQGPKGEQGEQGIAGQNGITPAIKDGYWWIGDKNTGVPVQGPKGETGVAGKDGLSPHIGENGNWWIGKIDTNIKAQGEQGTAGASAYELWVKDVKDGKITDKQGKPWSKEEISMADFYRYLSGKDGKDGENGKSAYELWKESAATGKLPNPQKPTEMWPKDQVTEQDFYLFLTGKDGADGLKGADGVDGKEGLSAYEVWKNDLKERCGTENALTDHKTGGIWKCEKNTLDDFYAYLRGKDGKDGEDGKDGKPSEPGMPGAEVTIIKGIPNVIAQYSQSEFGEYVRTTDGGVLYKVYDETGIAAPHAKVKGLPGLDANKSYETDEKGEFIIPKEDLPSIQEVEHRWGAVKEVTLAGKEPKESAKNTYVPNRVQIRLTLYGSSFYLSDYQRITFNLERKLNPEDDWSKVPTYLPNIGRRNLEAYQVADGKDPKTIQLDKKLYSYVSTSSGSYAYYIETRRFMIENSGQFKNNQETYWGMTDVYYSVKDKDTYYGEELQWNGTCLLAPHQMGPVLKKLKLKSLGSGEVPSFSLAEGEFDFSHMDFSKIYKNYSKLTQDNGIDYIRPEAYTEVEAKDLKMAYIRFYYSSPAGGQEATSNNNRSSFNEPTFKVFAPFLNSTVSIQAYNNNYNYFYTYSQGYLRKGSEEDSFAVIKYNKNYTFSDVEVTYEP